MKLLTLWEPWATAIALGLKKYETRHWATNYRGALAIHSAKRKIDKDTIIFFQQKYPGSEQLFEMADKNRGGIVAICDLKECHIMDEELINKQSELELTFGNWQPGRVAWKLKNIIKPIESIKCRGCQGLKDVPKEIVEQIYCF